MKNLHWFLLLTLLINNYTPKAQTITDNDSIKLFTQELINGIANGDTTGWAKYLDDRCIITSENGSVKTKEQFIH